MDGFDAVLRAAQRGDEWAVAVLYRDVRPGLARFLEAREPRAAQDLEGEVWLAVAQGLARLEIVGEIGRQCRRSRRKSSHASTITVSSPAPIITPRR